MSTEKKKKRTKRLVRKKKTLTVCSYYNINDSCFTDVPLH